MEIRPVSFDEYELRCHEFEALELVAKAAETVLALHDLPMRYVQASERAAWDDLRDAITAWKEGQRWTIK